MPQLAAFRKVLLQLWSRGDPQRAVWDSAIPSFPLLLRDAGYQIGKSYKVWSPGKPADAPIGGQQYAYEKSGRLPNKFSSNVTKMVADGATVDAAREKILDQVRGNFKAFLADQKQGQPWLYFFGPTNTHRPWVKGSGKQLWGIDPDAVKGKMPKFLPDVPEVREDVADNLGEAQAVDAYVGVLVKMVEEAVNSITRSSSSAATMGWAGCRERSAISMISG